MRIIIDTEQSVLEVAGSGTTAQYPLFSPEAFGIVSRQWIVLGWNLGHWQTLSWMGRQFLQLPDDMLRLAELFWTLRPDVIVETGVYDGGSTLFFASLCRLHGPGRVISIEREFRPGVQEAVRQNAGDTVILIEGDSASPETALQVQRNIHPGERVCVFLDSDHSAQHVAAELSHLSPLVSEGCYLVVADSICPDLARTPNGESAWSWDHAGAAVNAFLASHPEFTRERPTPLFSGLADFTELSYFPGTWLRRH
ncbi:MAG: class I SAM-dependent methyltransferase [Acidobacteria bacterium]|nr:class I SAM-dependent methyltransferase [Acidobacteriota bacterium]MBI3278503.1 class I SAM-dependent methyltransferase [Acidobacteriota bacterium]